MICGYCDERTSWAETILGYATLVVLAEATTLAGATVPLPHHCRNIPEDVRARYADEINATMPC